MPEHKYTNKLINEKSPYLLQHAHNPVDWYPWGPEAFSMADSEDKPIFLSIGYSTCHWCHVMERESFEDSEVAEILNKNFIAIKVDREERPDIDHIYMTVCQSLTGQGGWPLTILMTPEKKPFFAGTYFPKQDRYGIAGLVTLLDRITDAWENNRNSLENSGNDIIDSINAFETDSHEIDVQAITDKAFSDFKKSFDCIYGGFSNAPKFPSPHNLTFLLRYWKSTAVEMVKKTLDSMQRGGIYDHIGGGFCRYSTDKKWLVPHFEKMLYDNALLSMAYLETYQVTKNERYGVVARDVLQYVLRDMTSEEGGFYSAEDADSEGEEGKFYVWSAAEINRILGDDDGAIYCSYYDITEKGNFEGSNIPNLIKSDIEEEDQNFIKACNQKLFQIREARVHPYKDDKILTSWNGLMIAAMSMGGKILGNNKFIDAAEKALDFIESKLVRHDGRLMARFRDGDTAYPAYVDDYAFLIWGLIELYESTYKPKFLKRALELNDDLLRLFNDNEKGGLFIYGSDSEQLISRPKKIYDGATPSGNSVTAYNLFRLARLTGKQELEELAYKLLNSFGTDISRFPQGHAFSLSALLFARSSTQEIVLVGDQNSEEMTKMLSVIQKEFRPFTLSMVYSEGYMELKEIAPFVENYTMINNSTTAYVCENFACKAPVANVDELVKLLDK